MKGGTGRSLALANVAVYLASIGEKVLCIDMDIQAPGLYTLFSIPEELRSKTPSIVDLLLKFGETDLPVTKFMDVGNFVNLKEGNLFIIPAFPMDKKQLIELTRRRELWEINYLSLFVQKFLKPMCEIKNINYILIDARSGLAEESMWALSIARFISDTSLCLLFTRLDMQSRNVTLHALNLFNQYQYEFPVELVISNVPSGNKKVSFFGGESEVSDKSEKILMEFIDKISETGGKVVAVLPFDEEYLLEPRIITPQEETQMAKSYKNLAEYLRNYRS